MEVQYLHNKDIDREKWDEFVKNSPQASIYALSGLLDIVHPSWKAIIAKETNYIGILPVFPNQKWGIQYSFQPRFGQHQGILFANFKNKALSRQYSKKRKIVQAFTEILQKEFSVFAQNFSPFFDYPLPFHWAGFTLYARFNYQLHLEGSDEESLFDGFERTHKRQINKAQKRGISLSENSDPDTLLTIFQTSMADNKAIPVAKYLQTYKQIIDWALMSEAGFLLTLNCENKPVSSGLFLQLNNTTYFVMGYAEPQAKQSGAMYLLVWEALKKINNKGQVFDFEGSMIQPIERFFQGFGPQPIPYLHIYKNQLPLRILWQMFGY